MRDVVKTPRVCREQVQAGAGICYDNFLAVLSHELRNPLASIQSSLQILDRADSGSDRAKRAKAVLDRQFSQLARLVDNLTDITRITQKKKIRLQRRRLELNSLVRRTVEDHRQLFERNGLSLEVEYDVDPIFILADVTRLTQVIGGLLQNAAKFTPRGGRIHVSLAHDPLEKQAMIRVLDTGVGIAQEMLPLIFQPFTQVHGVKSRRSGGLGFGLALAKGLVELHGGEIYAYSAGRDKGVEFIVRLPLDERPADEAEDETPKVAGTRRRILIIEDRVDLAESLRELLELDGHLVEVAYNGPEGLVKACEFCPQVLLCDIGLPGMDGYAVAKAFRADEKLKEVFLVALSGYTLPEDLQRAAEAGFDRHLAKPPDLLELEEMLAGLPDGALDA